MLQPETEGYGETKEKKHGIQHAHEIKQAAVLRGKEQNRCTDQQSGRGENKGRLPDTPQRSAEKGIGTDSLPGPHFRQTTADLRAEHKKGTGEHE